MRKTLDPKALADKYIARDGGAPQQPLKTINRPMDDQASHDILCVASFLLWQDTGTMRGGYRAAEAYDAFCRRLNLNPARLRAIVKGA
ncbi:hypothetical protein [Labrys sp. (in: a-proteobacteria)]|uniref:hypothetical protein n=1 Tax=Labrys sp. (in: a-proteobacteria) TaxID=1917972 RepID=UPI0039E6BBD7